MIQLLIIALTATTLFSQYPTATSPDLRKSGSQLTIQQVKGETIRVKLLDAVSCEVIANSEVKVQSDNGVRCVRPPCPTNHRTWKGKTDDRGYVLVPKSMVQHVTTINTPSHKEGRDLIRDATKDATGVWVAELLPNQVFDGPNLGSRAIKIIDSQTNRAIANTTARIKLGEIESIELKTNALGYIFIPLEKAEEGSWVTIPGYRRGKIDFSAIRYKIRLDRL